MTIRDALLGVLSIGPTYGHQLLHEIHTRLPHRAGVNPGQVYSTLNRLVEKGLVQQAGLTADNLPAYALSPLGQAEAERWLAGDSLVDLCDWNEVLDVTLLTTTVPGADPACLLAHMREGVSVERNRIATSLTDGNGSASGSADSSIAATVVTYTAARARHLDALDAWFDDVDRALQAGEIIPHGLTENRPGRGRRSSAVAAPRD